MKLVETDCAGFEGAIAFQAFGDAPDCGDGYLATACPQGALFAVVDGLGHGPEACYATQAATATLQQYAGAPMRELIVRCHEALKCTRGAVLSLAHFHLDTGVMEWSGIGNVDGVLLQIGPDGRHTRTTLLMPGGVVGYRLPPLRITQAAFFPGDTLIFATDGIDSNFPVGASRNAVPTCLAADILVHHGKNTDDALVLVARFAGST